MAWIRTSYHTINGQIRGETYSATYRNVIYRPDYQKYKDACNSASAHNCNGYNANPAGNRAHGQCAELRAKFVVECLYRGGGGSNAGNNENICRHWAAACFEYAAAQKCIGTTNASGTEQRSLDFSSMQGICGNLAISCFKRTGINYDWGTWP